MGLMHGSGLEEHLEGGLGVRRDVFHFSRHRGPVPSRTNQYSLAVRAQMAAYPDTSPLQIIPHPKSFAAQMAYTESLFPGYVMVLRSCVLFFSFSKHGPEGPDFMSKTAATGTCARGAEVALGSQKSGFSISQLSNSHTVLASGREASEKKRAEARRGQGQCWGKAGDGARELLPWTANPGAQKHFDPEHPLEGGSKGSSLACFIFPWLIQFVLWRVFALRTSHPSPNPPQSLLSARSL